MWYVAFFFLDTGMINEDINDKEPIVAALIIDDLDRTQFDTLLYDTAFDLKHVVSGNDGVEPPDYPVYPHRITAAAFTKDLHDIAAKYKVASTMVQPYTHRLMSPMQLEVSITDTKALVRTYALSACTKCHFEQEETARADHILGLGLHVTSKSKRDQAADILDVIVHEVIDLFVSDYII